MSTITACIFPDTVPGDEIIFPLVQVFSRIVYCRAVEQDDIPEGLRSQLLAELEEAGICTPVTPAPLGEDRERFLTLVRNLRERGDDYAAHLKNLSLAGIGSAGGGSEVKSSIVGTLLKTGSIDDREQEKLQLLLWQARLLLKLGENYDAVQLDLQRDLERIGRKESGLFAELREEQYEPWELTRTITAAAARSDGLQPLRFKAWSRLFCLGERAPDPDCFITTNQDGSDLLAEQYERLRQRQGTPLGEILLPATPRAGWNLERLQTLREGEAGARLGAFLAGNGNEEDFSGRDSEWTRLLEQVWPAAEYGRCRLRLTRFASITARELFMATFGRDQEFSEVESRETSTDLVVGLLVG